MWIIALAIANSMGILYLVFIVLLAATFLYIGYSFYFQCCYVPWHVIVVSSCDDSYHLQYSDVVVVVVVVVVVGILAFWRGHAHPPNFFHQAHVFGQDNGNIWMLKPFSESLVLGIILAIQSTCATWYDSHPLLHIDFRMILRWCWWF